MSSWWWRSLNSYRSCKFIAQNSCENWVMASWDFHTDVEIFSRESHEARMVLLGHLLETRYWVPKVITFLESKFSSGDEARLHLTWVLIRHTLIPIMLILSSNSHSVRFGVERRQWCLKKPPSGCEDVAVVCSVATEWGRSMQSLSGVYRYPTCFTTSVGYLMSDFLDKKCLEWCDVRRIWQWDSTYDFGHAICQSMYDLLYPFKSDIWTLMLMKCLSIVQITWKWYAWYGLAYEKRQKEKEICSKIWEEHWSTIDSLYMLPQWQII